MARVNNLVEIPTRNLVALGRRHFLRIGEAEAMLRVQVDNLFDNQSWEMVDANAFQPLWPRRLLDYLTIDF